MSLIEPPPTHDRGAAPNDASSKDAALRRQVVLSTASNYAGIFVSIATLFLLTPFILNRLGPAAYGLWVLLSSVVAYGSLLDFGLWGAVIKHVAAYRARGEHGQAQALIATALRLYAGLGLVVVLLTLAAAPLIPRWIGLASEQRPLATELIWLMGLGVGLSLPGMMPLSVLRGLVRYDLVNIVEVTATLVTAALSVVFLLAGSGVRGLVLANLSGIVVTSVVGSLFVQRAAPSLRLTLRGGDRQLMRELVAFSWPLAVKELAARLQTRTDEITIGVFLPIASVAFYNVARRLSEATHLLAKQFMKVLLPLASVLHAENDPVRLRALFLAGTRVTLALATAIGGVLILLAAPILRLWVGPEYAGAAPLVVLLTTASLLAATQWPAGAVLQGMSRHRLLAATALGSGIANLVLSLVLVGPFGLTGVALGTLIPAIAEFAILVPYTMRVIHVGPAVVIRQALVPAIVPGLLMAAVFYALRPFLAPVTWFSVGAGAAIGLAAFAAGYVALGASPAERKTYHGLAIVAWQKAQSQFRRRV